MRNFLIYGGRTPLGQRITYYLTGYSEFRGLPVNVISQHIPSSMEDLQRDVWDVMVGKGTASRPDCIINCLTMESVQAAQYDMPLAWSYHARVPAMLAMAAAGAGITFVQISSDMVFGGDEPGRAGAPKKPRTVYGYTLSHGENIVRRIYPRDGLQGAFIIRHSYLYGLGTNSEIDRAMTAGAVRVSNQDTSPSFIGETAFIIARNLLESEKSLNKGEGILHVATPKHHVSPYHMVADDTQAMPSNERYGPGLEHTDAWALSAGGHKQFSDYRRELEANSYIQYW